MKTTPFHLMAKPVGPHCNMACRYCFYSEKVALFRGRSPGVMGAEVLEAYIRGMAESLEVPEIPYAWQGGEPTLAGLEFFRKAVELQRRYSEGRRVTNALQTNGLLLDDEWCAFLAHNGFLVGLSLDGPREVHDMFRRDAAGRSQFDAVVEAVRRMQRWGVEFNVLTVVSRANVDSPLEVYRFLRDLGVRHMQFIPLVERPPDDVTQRLGLRLAMPPGPGAAAQSGGVMPWCPDPAAYGRFLCAIFDEWIRHDVGRVFVQHFEVALANWMGIGSGVCHFAPVCGRALVLESNGDVYACDHYVYPAFRRGNILETPLAQLVDSPEQVSFGRAKKERLSSTCLACPWLFACNGECPKHRFLPDAADDVPRSYLCEAYRMFFSHADPYLRRIAALLQSGLPATAILEDLQKADLQEALARARRNDPCPCGSGRKFKHCHGRGWETAARPTR